MGARQLRTLVEGGAYFEGPRWHEGRWWVSDFYRYGVFSVDDADGRGEQVAEVEGQPAGLRWLPDGSLQIVSMRDHKLLRLIDGRLSVHADVSEFCGGHLNDLVVSSEGRAYVGNFGFDLMGGEDGVTTNLVRVDPDGSAQVAADGLMFPNGSVIDGDTLLVAETLAGRITAFTIGDDGSLSDRRLWGQVGVYKEPGPLAEMLPGATFAPDGIALDADGHVWAADGLGGPPSRFAPGGEKVEEIPLPNDLGAFAVMLGGEDGKTLLICSAPDFAEENRKAAREAILFTTTVDVPVK